MATLERDRTVAAPGPGANWHAADPEDVPPVLDHVGRGSLGRRGHTDACPDCRGVWRDR
jgi:hypothetical protein